MSDFDPFDFTEYRALVRSWIEARASRSQASLGRKVGVSRSTVAMVLAGERDVPLSRATSWASALDLVDEARAYFMLLVRADSPVSLDLRRLARTQAAAVRDAQLALRPSLQQARLLGRWYVPVILELSRTEGFRLEPAWLTEKIWPEVELGELADTVDALVGLGILRVRDGVTVVDHPPISTNRQLTEELSKIGRAYHRTQLEHASVALEEQSSEVRHVASLAVAIDANRLPELRTALHRFQLEVIEPFRVSAGGDTVVQVSVQLFSRTR